jgi:hypothetical protein
LALTVHIVASVGWLGSVIAFAGLSVVAVLSTDPPTVRAVQVAMNAAGWPVLVPLSLLSLVSGTIQGLGTRWGLLRHYWVVIKLAINVVASVVLVLYMETLRAVGDETSSPHANNLSPLIHSVGALALLLAATALSVFKPQGLTRFGQRKSARTST